MNQNPLGLAFIATITLSVIYPPLALPIHIVVTTLHHITSWHPMLKTIVVLAELCAMTGIVALLFTINRTFGATVMGLYLAGSYFHFAHGAWHASLTASLSFAVIAFISTLWISAKTA